MPQRPRTQSWPYSNRVRAGVSVAAGILGGLLAPALHFPALAPLVGWDVTAAVYVLWVAVTVFRLDDEDTSALAESEDPDRLTADAILLLASIASLGAVGMTLIQAGQAEGTEKTILIVTGVVSVILSWLLVHTVFTLRYAGLYFDECDGGIDFNEPGKPSYVDFAYLAFTVGMTFQVSDTNITDRRIRRAVLHHALLSYLFGTVIVATTINLIAGLSK
jgi:uncharacterized membrane protein